MNKSRLTIMRKFKGKDGRPWVEAKCECGGTKITRLSDIRAGNTLSCGCLNGNTGPSHGMFRTPTHNSWKGMIQRCRTPSYVHFHRYGGRGITVCERWLKFENFLADMGMRPEGKTLDRINNDGNYEPGNCRWATNEEQNKNHSPNCPHCKGRLRKRNGQFESEKWAWETFATAYPHEAAELDWPRFVAYTQSVNPAISEEEIRRLLKETQGAEK